jgi:hypothetical protein
MRTIFYLLDLYEGRLVGNGSLVETFEGVDDSPPTEAVHRAEERTKTTGHAHVLARGKLFFQAEKR